MVLIYFEDGFLVHAHYRLTRLRLFVPLLASSGGSNADFRRA